MHIVAKFVGEGTRDLGVTSRPTLRLEAPMGASEHKGTSQGALKGGQAGEGRSRTTDDPPRIDVKQSPKGTEGFDTSR